MFNAQPTEFGCPLFCQWILFCPLSMGWPKVIINVKSGGSFFFFFLFCTISLRISSSREFGFKQKCFYLNLSACVCVCVYVREREIWDFNSHWWNYTAAWYKRTQLTKIFFLKLQVKNISVQISRMSGRSKRNGCCYGRMHTYKQNVSIACTAHAN